MVLSAEPQALCIQHTSTRSWTFLHCCSLPPFPLKKVKAGPQSMYDAFKKWTLLGHTFTFVKLTPEEVKSLGAATRQFLEPDGNGDNSGVASVRDTHKPRREVLIVQPEFPVRVPESTPKLDPLT